MVENINNSEFVLALERVDNWGKTKVANYIANHGYDLEECLKFLEIVLEPKDLLMFDLNVSVAKTDLKENKNKNIESISLFDERFPKKLCESKEPVTHLFYVGDVSLLQSKCITIIGTRKPDKPFADNGYDTAKYYAEKGYTVVSGLALGCDTIAHRAALDVGGKTIAILPSSIDKVVPSQNKDLLEEIIKNGGLVISEYSITSVMNKFNYPQRDRIQSLLSNVTIVIQSQDDGGAMIAAKKSLKDNKKVYAVKGNNLSLIKDYIDINDSDSLKEVESKL